MVRVTSILICVALLTFAGASRAATSVDDLKREVEKLRKDLAQKQEGKGAPIGKVDEAVSGKYGPNAPVKTKNGKLQIGGLVQVWYQSVQNDHKGLFIPAANNNLDNTDIAYLGNGTVGATLPESNETHDNDTFRIRRTELRFTLDIHENVLAHVMLDPTRESNVTYLPLPTFPSHNARFMNPVANPTFGSAIRPQLLQDAYINYHDVVPHHDFTIGQFKPPSGEEAWRNSGQLEFVERAMVTGINNVRDIGAMVHGTWLPTNPDNPMTGRVQYWFGVFNGPDGTVLTDPEINEGGNRSDDNDAKDFAWRIAVRPVWNPDKWYGRLELGYHRTDGYRGESSGIDRDTPLNAINEPQTAINRQGAWVWFRPGAEVKGWWLRGEWGSGHDRYSFHQQPVNALATGNGSNDYDYLQQLNPTPVTASGWYFGTGYKMSETIFAEHLKAGNAFERALHNMEFAFRYEAYQNIATEDLVLSDRHTDLFKTQAYTAGLNYYLKGHDIKLQANYIWVDEPQSREARGIREMKNNVFVVAFQVMF
ncbi:MAG: porin [Planctomycetota bacterium]|nr:porin [Planctomycetota bacterium]